MTKQQPTITDIPDWVWELPTHKILEMLDTARSKTDLKDWTGCPPMHLNKEPVENKRTRLWMKNPKGCHSGTPSGISKRMVFLMSR